MWLNKHNCKLLLLSQKAFIIKAFCLGFLMTGYAQTKTGFKKFSDIEGGGGVYLYKNNFFLNFGGNTPTDGNTYNSIVALFNSNYDTLSTTIYKIPNTNSGTFCGFFPITNSKQKIHYWGVIDNYGSIPFSGMNFLFAQANQSNYTLNSHRVYHSIHYHRPNYATQFINDTVLATTHWFRLSHPSSLPYCTSMWWLNAKTFDTLSQKIYGNPNADLLGTSIIPLANKDVLVSGFTDTLNIFGDPMPYDAFLMRLDSAGNVKFCKSIGTHGHDNMYLTKVGQKYYYIGSSFNGVTPVSTTSLSVLYMAEVDITNGTINKAYKMDYGSYGVLSYEPSVQQSKIYIPCLRVSYGTYNKACYFLIDTNGIVSKQYIHSQASNGYLNSYTGTTIVDSLKSLIGTMFRYNSNSDPVYPVLFKLDSNLVGCYPSDTPYSFTTTIATGDFHSLPMSISITRDSLYEVFGTINQGHGFNTIVDECSGYVGINEHELGNEHFKVYPNPSAGMFYYEYNTEENNNQDATLTVLNMLGEIIVTGTINTSNPKGMIDLSTMPNGIYFISIYNAHKQLFNSKLSVVK